jgi:antitoxin component of MazEF toxin-antitoxin module
MYILYVLDMSCKIHKINKLSKASRGVILPKRFLQELGLDKGDFVEIHKENNKITIKKLEV